MEIPEYAKIFNEIEESHKKVMIQQAKFDKGLNKTHGGAIALQIERNNLKALRNKLPKARLVITNDFIP